MRIFLYIAFFLISTGGHAQSKKERIVLSNERLLEETVFGTKDSATLEKLFGKTVHYQHSGGKVETREEAIRNISHNKSSYIKPDVMPSAASVMAQGDSVVVTKDFVATEKKADGKETALDLSIRTVWMKEKGKWKLYRRVATKNKH